MRERRGPPRDVEEIAVQLSNQLARVRPGDDWRPEVDRLLATVQSEYRSAVETLLFAGVNLADRTRRTEAVIMGDNINVRGGVVATRGAQVGNAELRVVWNECAGSNEPQVLLDELARLRAEMRTASPAGAHDAAIGNVADAEEAIRSGDGPGAIEKLRSVGAWTLDIATKIGTSLAAEVIKKSIGM